MGRGSPLSRAAALCLISLAGLLAPAPAGAATAGSQIDRFSGTFFGFYDAAVGESNNLSLTTVATEAVDSGVIHSNGFIALESGQGVDVEARGCAPLPGGAACSSHLRSSGADDPVPVEPGTTSGWEEIAVRLGDGDDRLMIDGLRLGSMIHVHGGEGDDVLDLHNRVGEDVDCGPGVDTALIDDDDLVDGRFGEYEGTSCENLVVHPCSPLPLGCLVPFPASRRVAGARTGR